ALRLASLSLPTLSLHDALPIFVSSVAHRGTEIYAAPDANSPLVGTLKSDTPVCAQAVSEGFGFRRVKLTDGRTGFVAEQSISNRSEEDTSELQSLRHLVCRLLL